MSPRSWSVAAGVVLLLCLGSCAGEPPQLYQNYWRLDVVTSPDGGAQHERLSLFVQAGDEDGFEDLSSLLLTHHEAELTWELSGESWHRVQFTGEDWVGSGSLYPPKGEIFPRGSYRLVLKDRAGEQAESGFYLDPQIRGLSRGELPDRLIPALSAGESGGLYFPFEERHLLLLNGQQQPIRAVPVEEFISAGGGVNTATLQQWRSDGARFFSLNSYSRERGFGVERGPYALERLSEDLPADPAE